MEDFRVRRRVEAHKRKWEPGLAWEYKVDGRIVKKALLRKTEEGGRLNEVRKIVLGDTGFADDTAILGMVDEVTLISGERFRGNYEGPG